LRFSERTSRLDLARKKGLDGTYVFLDLACDVFGIEVRHGDVSVGYRLSSVVELNESGSP